MHTASLAPALQPPLKLALSGAKYWPADGAAQPDGRRYDGPAIGAALLAKLAAEGKPATPEWCEHDYLWRCCTTAAAVRWLAASGCAAGGLAHGLALVRHALDEEMFGVAAELAAAGAEWVGDAATPRAQVGNAFRAMDDLMRSCTSTQAARTANAAPVLASLAAAAQASHGPVIARAIAASAAAFAARAEAHEAELAASDAITDASIPAVKPALLAHVATLDDFKQVVMVALVAPELYARDVALQTLRRPFPEHPDLTARVLAMLDAWRAMERKAESAAEKRYLRAGRARNARVLSNAVADALGLPQVAAPVQPEPEQVTAEFDELVTLQCRCGGSVVAPKSAVDSLQLHHMFEAEADVYAAGSAALLQIPVTATQLRLVFDLIAATNGKPVSAAGIDAAAEMLEERCRAPGAGEAEALPLMVMFSVIDFLGAPLALTWAAAAAAARALKREGEAYSR